MKYKNTLLLFAMLGLPCTFHASGLNQSACGVMAEENTDVKPTHFILCFKDGGTATFLLKHSPKVTNGDGFITVTDADVTIDYPLSDVDRYTMGVEETPNSIDEQEISSEGTFETRYGTMILSGFKPGSKVIVSSLGGSCVYSGTINAEGYSEIDTSVYTPGVYIFKINNQTFKITKR